MVSNSVVVNVSPMAAGVNVGFKRPGALEHGGFVDSDMQNVVK